MRKKMVHGALTLFLLFVMMMGSGCAAHSHVVGNGGSGNDVIELRQWYVLWGLVPINEVDTADMAGNATNYTIDTEQSALDVIINIFTSFVTVYSRTVTVTR